MQNITPPDIARNIQHPLCAVERYVTQFSRAAFLFSKGVENLEIAFILEISTSLTAELKEIFNKYSSDEKYKHKIREIISSGKDLFEKLDLQKKTFLRGK